MRPLAALALIALAGAPLAACTPEPDPGLEREVGYRTGTADDDYRSNGERGNVQINEVNWAGSVRGNGLDRVWDPDDIFIELQNKHSRPVHFTGWQLQVETGADLDTLVERDFDQRATRTYTIPLRESGRPVEPNEFVVIAKKRDGAFEADYYIEDLEIPRDGFSITLLDLDNRLIDGAGDARKAPFAGAWDRVTARSMERIQLIFNNRGDRDAAWHTYSINDFATGEREVLHTLLRARVREDWRALTFATPGMPNSPDYSGYISSGSFE
ncbi:MAG: hypothetical protein H6705_21090 [Myxococcales bacterium]|nr:hypothetical protein [Myxococcales bacterium]